MKTLLLIFLILSAPILHGQNFNWAKQFGGSLDSYGSKVVVDATGNVYTTGYFTGTVDFDPGPGVYNLTQASGAGAYISKLDANGNFVWAKQFTSWNIVSYSIGLDASGNVYTTGFFQQIADFDPGPGVYNLTTSGTGSDVFISKLDNNGNFVWAKQFGGIGNIYAGSYDIAVDALGNVYTVGGFSGGAVDFDPGSSVYNLTPVAFEDIFVSKLDANGNFVWAKQFGGPSYEEGESIKVDASGNVYTTGYFQGTVDFDPGPGVFNLTSGFFISKLDANGNFVLAKAVTGASQGMGENICVDASNNIYIAGYFRGTADFDPGPGVNNLTANDIDAFLLKLDANGNFSWVNQFGGSYQDRAHEVVVDAAGAIYLTGDFNNTVDFDPGPGVLNFTSAGGFDMFILKLDNTGNLIWAKQIGGSGDDISYSIKVDAGENVYSTGLFDNTVDFDPGASVYNLTSLGGDDGYVLKLSLCTTPTITAFAPTSGPIGTTVTITGNNFDPIPANNIVYFGATKANVTSATTTTLTVTVPLGATYHLITVTNSCNLTASSVKPFIVTFPCGGTITTSSFAPKIDFGVGVDPADAEIGDFDGDGMADVVASSEANSPFISVFRNTSTTGNISFAPRQDFSSNYVCIGIDIGDLDGDGKLDIAEASIASGSVSLFRNTSAVGNISFAPKIDLISSSTTRLVSIADFDGDGRPDIVATNEGANTISIFKNNSAPGSISFSPKVDYTIGLDHTWGVCTGDIDGDGKPDIAVTNYTNSFVSVFRNTSTGGNISFAPKINFTPGTNPTGITIGDLDGDGKLDLAIANQTSNDISVLLNTSTIGNISFAPKVDFITALKPSALAINDLDGDGKPDLAAATLQSGVISILKNTSTIGNISFAPKVDFLPVGTPISVALGDLDGDTQPDCVTSNWISANSISIFRNTTAIVLTPSVVISTPSTTICSSTSATFTAVPTNGGTTPVYQWQVNGANVGTNSPAYTTSSLINGDVVKVIMTSNASCASPTTVTSNSITVTVLPAVTPSVNISATATTICSGQSVIFTATPLIGGTSPIYQWQVNGVNVGINSPTYATSTLVNGDNVKVIMTSNANCATPSTVNSNTITMIVSLPVTPSVNISTTSTTICAGTSVNFIASPINGGSNPSYQWQVNGVNVGTNSPTYTTSTLVNGDVVKVIMISNANCAIPSTVNSNTIIMVVNPTVIPLVTIIASSTSICVGDLVVFTASPTNGGTTPIYQWKVNGINVGTNSPTFSTTALLNGDVITVVMISNANCVSPTTVTSNSVTMSVTAGGAASVSIVATNNNICAGTNVTFTATPTNGGSNPSYQWQVNGVNIGINSSTFSSSTLSNGDIVRVIITSNLTCATGSPATSNSIVMNVSAIVPASVVIGSTTSNICSGTSVTFTATPTNGGNNPSYQWQVNGVNVGTNSSTFSSSTLSNTDIIKVVMVSALTCVSGSPSTSNPIVMSVTPSVTPSVSISSNNSNICAGDIVTFTNSPVNGGPSPTYQWKVNGNNVGSNSPTYSSNTFANGDIVTLIMTSNATCANPINTTSNPININVSQRVTPSVTIATSATTICTGTPMTFTSNAANGGTVPTYQWQVNGVNVGTNTSTYSTNSLADGDIVKLTMTSSITCTTLSTVTSNSMPITVINTVVAPSINITSVPNTICYGTQVTFTALSLNGGSSPLYQWMVNGVNAGANSPSYVTNSLSNGDIVKCQLTSNAQCPSPRTVASNDIIVAIDPNLCPQNFYMPTAFTPNMDGKNDMLKPTVFGNVIQYKLMIFNRWGKKVFETTNLNKGWDGKVNGHETNSDVFVWYSTFQFQGKTPENRKGTVALIH